MYYPPDSAGNWWITGWLFFASGLYFDRIQLQASVWSLLVLRWTQQAIAILLSLFFVSKLLIIIAYYLDI